ncbi:muscle M-line assembly protein unc-89-like isoform X2 [Uloborus diversus]|nr:muscle M-line assembly protein unc-89-like isoform X2 [Uloborus diversus]
MHPAMTDIGSNLREATELHQQHEKVLEKLQTKQSPVEELLRQADDLISTQKPRGEVYSAMAENLGLAWKDLNAQLEQRRQILEQAVAFFSKAEQFVDSLEIVKKSVSETFLPNTAESTTALLNRLKEERKGVLSNSMRLLSEGQLLLERLCEVATHSMGDSRPQHMEHAARSTASFVERHMESLQDRWRLLESLWNQKKMQLEQCLLKCKLEAQLEEIENWLRIKGLEYTNERNLGDSLACAEILQHEHQKAEHECKDKQEHCLRLVKSAEDLHTKGNYAGEELRSRAYLLLSDCAELVSVLEQRQLLLANSVSFFNKAQTAQTKLDQIEIHLSTSETPASSSTVEDIANPAIEEGRHILSSTGITESGAQGILRKVEELEAKKKHLVSLCKAKESAASEKSSAFRKFCEKYDELIKWLSNNGQFFIQRTRDIGTTQTAAKCFVDQHESLQNDLRMKGMEMEALLKTVPNLVRSGGEEAEVVHSKSENLRQLWSQLRTALEKRILISQKYAAFLKLATKVTKEMDDLESSVKQAIESPNPTIVRGVEEKQLSIRQEFLQLNNNGKNFIEDARKVDDPYLNMSQPCSTVEDILNRLELRNTSLNTLWLNFQNEMSATKETLLQWEHLIRDSNRVIKCSQELEHKMFPVIPAELSRVDSILPFLENRMSVLVPQIKSVQKEMESFLTKSEALDPKDDPHREGRQILQNLKDMNQSFQKKLTDYQILLSMMTTFFKNFEELEKLVDLQESQFKMNMLPADVPKVEVLYHDHFSNKNTVMELFKFSDTEAQQLIKKINESEPATAATQDREKILQIQSTRKASFERAWEDHKNKLEQHKQLCMFNRDMHLINQRIEEQMRELASIRESYGDSLVSARHTSETFEKFEKYITTLEICIREFVNTAEQLMYDQRVDSSQLQPEIQTMQKKFSTFRAEVGNHRRLIDVAVEYYKTVEEAEEWLKEGSRLLISVARKSSSCTKESDAEELQKEVQDYLNKGRNKQEERMKKISTLSTQLFGNRPQQSSEMISSKHKEMMDSFSVIRTELTTLTTNIKITQQTKIVEQKGKEEIDAVLHAAQAEAEAAKAAAAAALQAARTAEAAVEAIPSRTPEPSQRAPRFLKRLADAEVPEGTKFMFECEVEGLPAPQVQWFKDGILVENNPDYQTSFENGICKLTIEETFSEDTATFTCRATNPAGVAETQSRLVVKESRPQSELIPPHFVQEPVDASVTQGEPYQMECHVFGNPLPLVSWFKDDVCIDNSTEYFALCNNGYCTLRIDEASAEHQGRYTCRAVNPVGQVACSANLTVTSALPSERPCFLTPLSNVMARAGQKLRLECTVTGQPEPQISWLHNSKPIKETRDSKFHFDGRNATLVITEAFPKDAGTYTIIARNKGGETVSSCNVSVKGRLPLETSDSEIASDIEPAKPQVKQQLDDQTVFEGNKVRMDCVIVGQPEPEVIWYHNGKPVKESDDFQLLFEGDRCTLIIKTAYLEDAGTYKCVAINSGGEASSICQLKVEPVTDTIQKSEFSQKDILISVERLEPPKFLKLLESSVVTEGMDVVLECKVIGEPEAALSWHKDGQQIEDSVKYKIEKELSGISRLKIFHAEPNDRGAYSVKAQNKVGEAQSFCTLSVMPTPPKFAQPPAEVPPTFLQHVENQVLPVGQSTRFETIVEGTPTPQVRWNFLGKPVPNDHHHEVGQDGKKHWLILKNLEKKHSGRYSAVAENNAGIATTSALLTIEEPVEISDSYFNEQRAQSTVMTKKETIMQTSTISSMPEVTDIDFQPPEFPSFSSLQSQELVMREESSFNQQLPTTPSTPPKFVKPVSTAVVTEGEKLLLEAQYDGVPEPTIQWFKDGVELRNKSGVLISKTGGNSTSLFVLTSSESDSGRYSCVASNEAGKATSVADVRIKPYREAPKFKRKLQASIVPSGSRVTLEVEVTGVPQPEVKWLRNGNQLQDSPYFRVSSSGNIHTLLISEVFPEDSGSYTVVASNVAGEARSLADLVVEEEKSPDEEKHISYQEFSSIQQKREMFTKISLNQGSKLEPYQIAPEKVTAIEQVPMKTPSPPPIPAVSAKVWTQPKPEPISSVITEAQEPILVPDVIEELFPAQTEMVPVVSEISIPEQLPTETIFGNAPGVSSMSESFVKQSIMKFSQPDLNKISQTAEKSIKIASQSQTFQPVLQNGFDSEMKTTESFSSVKQNTFISESKSFSSSTSMSTQKTAYVPTPSKFVPKPVEYVQKQEEPETKFAPVWKPPTETKQMWRKVQPPDINLSPQKTFESKSSSTESPLCVTASTITERTMETKSSSTDAPLCVTASTETEKMVETKSSSTDAPPVFTASTGIQNTIETKSSATETPPCATDSKLVETDSKIVSSTSCQTALGPSSFYSTESSTTTRTSYSKEEISITKKYETVVEHASDKLSSSPVEIVSKIVPKPIIKKEPHDGPKPKKEVVIEEEPVVGAEVKPPHFSKVRGAESLRKIFTEY